MRAAVGVFLRPEVLKRYVGKMDEEVREHLELHWKGRSHVKEPPRCRRTRDTVKEIVRERRSALDRGLIEPNRDVITSLICFDDGSERALTEEEIVDNVVFLMVAGHDTSSVLVTFIVRQLAMDPTIYDNVLRGQSLSLLGAMRTNTAEEWLRKRIEKYGPISKLTLFGRPTVFITGPVANKFLFTNEGNKLASQQPKSITRLLGTRNVMEMIGEEHKRTQSAIGMFLRPEVLKRYVGKMEDEVKRHLEMHWSAWGQLKVMPLMTTLTFDIISSLLFGLERARLREGLVKEFNEMMEGMWAVPVNLPFTRFNKSIRASQRIRNMLSKIVHDKRVALDEGRLHPTEDLITSLLSFGREEGARSLTEEAILDNVIIVMVAGHDTSSILITFLMRQLAKDPKLYEEVLRELEEIAKNKIPIEKLTREDLAKMKYTWRVEMEMLRMVAPVFGSFRRVLKEVEYEGYRIPEGWQVIPRRELKL
ncbi:hypothetical protein QJS10_CPA01g00924 [Acorus calamus]|uniref:Cytochrome P450 n=1 Tax=Acorus calamus TaxID=4465 RepID=A0AAV9FNL8_ACOCL|nr:hypothetical protein QJS10_CPA01g00924 [Acorus calamus]